MPLSPLFLLDRMVIMPADSLTGASSYTHRPGSSFVPLISPARPESVVGEREEKRWELRNSFFFV